MAAPKYQRSRRPSSRIAHGSSGPRKSTSSATRKANSTKIALKCRYARIASTHISRPPEETRDALDRFAQARHGLRVCDAHVALRLVRPEILARRDRDVRFRQHATGEGEAVVRHARDIRVDVEGALGHDRHAHSERLQRGHQEAAASVELRAALLEDLHRLR